MLSVQAILFLAPLAFNQMLDEDTKVNRLVRHPLHPSTISFLTFLKEDSLYLWRDICVNKLLARAHIILFLNKVRHPA